MESGFFISFEGTEGSGKSTQIERLAERIRSLGRTVRLLREPGGTPIGEEIRHTLQYSTQNQAMCPETELLLLNASRAQLVRQVIRPALAQGDIVICDRFYDSSLAYQGYGRGLDLATARMIISFAVANNHPEMTFYLHVPVAVSERRRAMRKTDPVAQRDRMEEASRSFFERVERGYQELAMADPQRIRIIDATRPIDAVAQDIWQAVRTRLKLAQE